MAHSAILRPNRGTSRSLRELAPLLGASHHGPDAAITGVALNTSGVVAGDIFVALQGLNSHGIDHLEAALVAGALAVLTDQRGASTLSSSSEIPRLVCEDPRSLLGTLASEVYGTAAEGGPRIFSVTGTNGKTSTVFLLEAMMRAMGWRTALSTTALRQVNGVEYSSTLTTPEAPDIHAMLALARESDVSGVALEVSAQALNKNRLDHVRSTVAGFTNLSHDHFEDFGTMENYLEAKAALFTNDMTDRAVVCCDTPWGVELASRMSIPVVTLAGSMDTPAEWHYEITQADHERSSWNMLGPAGQELTLSAPILGKHMVANAALAALMLISSGVEIDALKAAMGTGTEGVPVYIPGRVEKVSQGPGPQVYVDAGRSADAYEHTLETLRRLTSGAVVMVCGTSGNRDATKRPIMGKVAATLADVVIVTDDDPRKEDPAVIRAGLLEGARSVEGAKVHEIADPSEAIRFAVSLAGPGDTVVWCGPGSQSYRDIQGVKVPYSARDHARSALHEAGWTAS